MSAQSLRAAGKRASPEVAEGPIPLKKAAVIRCNGASSKAAERLGWHLSGLEGLHRNQFGDLAKVLSGGCEDELVTRAVWTSQP